MILKAPEIQMPPWLVKALGYFCMAIFSPVIALVGGVFAISWVKRKVFGPGEEWSRWFAWHPVSVAKDSARFSDKETRWFEVVERQSFGVMQNTYYRVAGSEWERPTW